MAKWTNDEVMDAALNVMKNGVTRMVACSNQPANFVEANATYALAPVTLASADFTIADGNTSGRKVTVAGKTATIATSGTATHVALLDVTNSKLLFVTTCTSLALVANGTNTVTFPVWKIEISDPT